MYTGNNLVKFFFNCKSSIIKYIKIKYIIIKLINIKRLKFVAYFNLFYLNGVEKIITQPR